MRYGLIHFLVPHPLNNHRALGLKNSFLTGYIAILLLTLVVFKAIPMVKPGILGIASNITTPEVIQLTNNQRTSRGLAPLKENSFLTQAAVAKANDMFANNYWAHISPSGTTPWDFIKGAGYKYASAGENLARDFDVSTGVVDAWMNSPSHRDNLLGDGYTEIGIGVVNGVLDGQQTTLVVQMFAKPAPVFVASAPQGGTTNQIVQSPAPPTVPAAEQEPKSVTEPLPTTVPTPFAEEVAAAPLQAGESVPIVNLTAAVPQSKLIINSYSATRTLTLALVGLLMILLVIDFGVAKAKSLARPNGLSLAHLGLLFVLVVAIWYTNAGLIL